MRKIKRFLAVLLAVALMAELTVSVIISSYATNPGIKTVSKQLLDFSDCETGEITALSDWPDGISPVYNSDDGDFTDPESFKTNSKFKVSLSEDSSQNKFLKFDMNKINACQTKDNITERASANSIYVKVSVPFWYIPYMKSIRLDYVYKYNTTSTDLAHKIGYTFGISDLNLYGKTDARAGMIEKSSSDTSGFVSADIADMYQCTNTTFLGKIVGAASAEKWTSASLESTSKVDVLFCFSPPKLIASEINKGFYFGIKGISVDLEGPEQEIDNVDNEDYIDPHIVNFEEGTDLESIKTATSFYTEHNLTHELVSIGTEAVPNHAYLFRRDPGTGQYDTRAHLKLGRYTLRSKGITFLAKNISDRALTYRIWIRVGSDKGTNAGKGKYQYVVTLPANMTQFQRISIYWNNVGLMNFSNSGEWWNNSSSGYSISDDEIASGISLTMVNSTLEETDAGTLFDDYEYITNAYYAERTEMLVDFSNAQVAGDLPTDVSVGGTYDGSYEIVENTDGSKALQLNYDSAVHVTPAKDAHHLKNRPYFSVSVKIPKGSFHDIASITANIDNCRDSIGTRDSANGIFTDTLALLSVGDSVNKKYGKSMEVNSYVSKLGVFELKEVPVGMLSVSSGSLLTYQDKTKVGRWTAEDMDSIDTVTLYISAPNSDGNSGECVKLNSISLFYNEPHSYNGSETIEILAQNGFNPVSSSDMTVASVGIPNSDPNYPEFTKAYEVNIKNTANTDEIVFNNSLIAFRRNLSSFMDTAVFHMFAMVSEPVDFDIALIDKNGARLSTAVTINPSVNKLYADSSVALKAVYERFLTTHQPEDFDLSDIRAVAIAPHAAKTGSFRIAGIGILSGAYVSNEFDPDFQKKINLLNFDNCEVGSTDMPSNVTLSSKYYGSDEIIQKADGSKALQYNMDSPVTFSSFYQIHQISYRSYTTLAVSVPEGSLANLSKVTMSVTNNSVAFTGGEGYQSNPSNIYYSMTLGGNGVYCKGVESCSQFNVGVGKTETLSFTPRTGFGFTNAGARIDWLNKNSAFSITDDDMKKFNNFTFFICFPECTGTEGWNIQINSIDLEFDNAPTEKAETRQIMDSSIVNASQSTTATITTQKLASTDINYRNFKKAYLISTKSGNQDYVSFTNGYSTFLRNASGFLNTATMRFFARTDKALKLNGLLVNNNGEKLPFSVDLTKSSSDLYDEYKVSLKQIYQAYLTANPSATFSLRDITGIKLKPDGTASLYISSPELWTREAGSTTVAGNFYFTNEDDSVRVEGYNYAIDDKYRVVIEKLDPVAMANQWGIHYPDGTKPLVFVKVSLLNSAGEYIAPSNRFWVSIRLPAGTDPTNVGIYRAAFDGSLQSDRHVIECNGEFITVNAFFTYEHYVVLSGLAYNSEEPGGSDDTTTGNPSDDNTDSDSTIDSSSEEDEYEYEYIYPDDNSSFEQVTEDGEEEVVDTETTKKVIRRKKIISYNDEAAYDYTWIWFVAGGAVVLIAAGVTVFLVIRKKRKGNQEA